MKRILAIILIAFSSLNLFSQYLEKDPPPTAVQRIFYGGDIGFAFGDVTQVQLNPFIGYRVANRLSLGVGFDYIYVNSHVYNFEGSIIGGNVFASFTIIKSMENMIPFFHSDMGVLICGQFSYTNIGKYYTQISDGAPVWISSPMLGLGLQFPMGQKSYLLVSVMYNFNDSFYSIYSNPVIKMCYQF